MMKSFNVKHTHTIELNLEKGGNESVTSEYTTFAHFYERKDGNKEERIIGLGFPLYNSNTRIWISGYGGQGDY